MAAVCPYNPEHFNRPMSALSWFMVKPVDEGHVLLGQRLIPWFLKDIGLGGGFKQFFIFTPILTNIFNLVETTNWLVHTP